MAMDGISLHFLIPELKDRLVGSNLDKIQQPYKHDLLLTFRAPGSPRLLLSANPSGPYVNLTEDKYINPVIAPNFCMFLRKHLQRARLIDIKAAPFDRTLYFKFQVRDAFSDLVERTLVMELVGRQSNLILLNENHVIMDCLVHVDQSKSKTREILPAHPYQPMALLEKPSPTDVLRNLNEQGQTYLEAFLTGKKLSGSLIGLAQGLSPLTVREIIFRAGLDEDTRGDQLHDEGIRALYDASLSFFNELVDKERKISDNQKIQAYFFPEASKGRSDCHPLCLSYLGPHLAMPGLIEALAKVHRLQRTQDLLLNRQNQLQRKIRQDLDKKLKLLHIYQDDIKRSQDYDRYRYQAELILSQLYQLPKRVPDNGKINVIDYYDPEQKTLEVELDPRYSVSHNAQLFFKTHDRLRDTYNYAKVHLEQLEEDIAYSQNLLALLDGARDEEDLDSLEREIKRMLPKTTSGKRKADKDSKNRGRKNPEERPVPPRKYRSSDGFIILAGRNNLQNDQLTFRQNQKHDLWFHAKDRPGSHVILKTEGKEVPESSILEAAEIASYLSQSSSERLNQNLVSIPVDYCPLSYVRKPKGAKPGFTLYDNYETLMARPLSHEDLRES